MLYELFFIYLMNHKVNSFKTIISELSFGQRPCQYLNKIQKDIFYNYKKKVYFNSKNEF